jgi:hypothetical protein
MRAAPLRAQRLTFTETGDFGGAGDLVATTRLVFRGEERLAFGVLRPAAFCTVTGL